MFRKLKLKQLADKLEGIDQFNIYDRNGKLIKKSATCAEKEFVNETVYRIKFVTKEERRHDMNGHPVFRQLINCEIYLNKEIAQ